MNQKNGPTSDNDQALEHVLPPLDKSVKFSVKIHDKTQLETRFDYLFHNSSLKEDKVHKCHIRVCMFLPKQIAINSKTYSKQQFYEDVNPLLRLKELQFSHKQLIGKSNHNNTPLDIIEELIDDTEAFGQAQLLRSTYLVKVFACSYSSYLKKRVKRFCRNIYNFHASGEQQQDLLKLEKNIQAIELFLKRAAMVRKKWYHLKSKLAVGNRFAGKLHSAMAIPEEHCFYRFRESVAKLALALQGIDRLNTSVTNEWPYRLRVWTRAMRIYAKAAGFQWCEADSSEREKESYQIRLGAVKKSVNHALYLSVDESRVNPIRMQFTYMLAAALAAGWAFIANLVILTYLHFGSSNDFGGFESILSLSGAVALMAYILSYVLKDRIKEVSREKIQNRYFSKTYDSNHNLYYLNQRQKNYPVGKVCESVDFVRRLKSLPLEIQRLRNNHSHKYTPMCDILLYRKLVVINRKRLFEQSQYTHGVRDILRLNIERFLKRLDNPRGSFLSINEAGHVQYTEIPKVYHIDLVISYSYEESTKNAVYEYKRIVLNKDGLLRIEDL